MSYSDGYGRAETLSIDLPPELLLKAEQFAEREQRSVSDLMRKALCRYLTAKPASLKREWNVLLKRTSAQGESLGVRSEADVERLSDEYRREKQRRSAS